ncbi:MAG: TrkH family potassium uptake protein [Desulfobacterota bacterium]|nr:TrkH family potassium uptake protein [Thermodesulfobacteriota bacterium]
MSVSVQIKPFLSRTLTPSRIFILSFAGVILVGTALLSLPIASAHGQLRLIDALFTSASAVCVTGLVVIDNGRDLSLFGQVVTILLFQIGGLGIITFSTIFFVLMGRGISFKGREIILSTYLQPRRGDLLLILRAILVSTLLFESAGTLVLFVRFSQEFPAWRALYLAAYHAISAFNNCGFSLFPDSLVRYQGDPLVNVAVIGLLVAGGIGFIVQYEIYLRGRGHQKRFSLHTKVVLLTTALLITLGALLFYLFERTGVLREVPPLNQLLASIFQSVTPRTCGFNTVDISGLKNATLLLLIVLMFIGASPGSTGGGIKTTSAALLVLMIWNRFRGNEEVNLFSRTIPKEVVSRTLSIIFASAFSISLVTSFLLMVGGQDLAPLESRRLFVEYLFEVVSAFGTVGLSMGVTPQLNDLQKCAIILMMFAGRVGPLTLAYSLSRSGRKRSLVYAEEGVMVG